MSERNDGPPGAGGTRHDPFEGLPEVLTLEEVEKLTRIPKQTLYRLIETGAMPAWRLGARNTRVWREELRAAIDAGRVTGGQHGGIGNDQPEQ